MCVIVQILQGVDPSSLELGLQDPNVEPYTMEQKLERVNQLADLLEAVKDSSDHLHETQGNGDDHEDDTSPCPKTSTFTFAQLGSQQQHAVTSIWAIVKDRPVATSQDASPIIIILSGGPGTGKTTACGVLLDQLKGDGLHVQATATTHAAKHRLGPSAKTLHRLLGLRPGSMLSALTATNRIAQELDPLDVVVTDEFTMLTAHTLCLGAYRLRNCTKPATRRKVCILIHVTAIYCVAIHCVAIPILDNTNL